MCGASAVEGEFREGTHSEEMGNGLGGALCMVQKCVSKEAFEQPMQREDEGQSRKMVQVRAYV